LNRIRWRDDASRAPKAMRKAHSLWGPWHAVAMQERAQTGVRRTPRSRSRADAAQNVSDLIRDRQSGQA
jgi:hypothetical protein